MAPVLHVLQDHKATWCGKWRDQVQRKTWVQAEGTCKRCRKAMLFWVGKEV
jgi:hypothetical protein